MTALSLNLLRWNRFSIGLGAVAWALLALLSLLGVIPESALELILLLALLVITPLAIPLAIPLETRTSRSGRPGIRRLAIQLQPFAALIGAFSFLASAGLLAAAAASVWLLFSVLVMVLGIDSLLEMRRPTLADICPLIALIYLPIGGAWLVISRLGWRPLGFSPAIVLLTAIHFHYITLAALVITGLIGRAGLETKAAAFPRQVYRVAAISMLIEPLLVAAGRTLAQLTGSQYLVSAASTLLALSLILLTLLSLQFVVPATLSPVARWLILVSSIAVFFTMLVAGAYALGPVTGAWTITISQMIALHGWINALVFSLCGLLGWRRRLSQQNG
jgi:hypothetical protein